MKRHEGQTLVLFALCLTVLMGVAALVVDIGLKYSTERRYQSIADGAALAGAQELQPTSRSAPVTTAMQDKARAAALTAIANELVPGTTPTCADWTNCDLAGGTYNVRIVTPSPTCVDCVPNRSVQVTVTEPLHQTAFARLFGQDTWRVSRTAVAGLSFGKQYTIVALRPPASGRLPSVKDIVLNGTNTLVSVTNGDVGSNANMQYDGSGDVLRLTTGYSMYYYDPVNAPLWDQFGRGPIGKHIGSLIPDPKYPVPGAPAAAGTVPTATCQAAATALLANAQYRAAAVALNIVGATGIPTGAHLKCLAPGSYASAVSDGNNDLTILMPGLYEFSRGLSIQSMLVGGYDPTQGGVTVMFPRTEQFKQRNGAVLLNAGTKFHNSAGVEPTTAPVMTGTTPNLKITVVVRWDPACPVTLPYPPLCNDNQNTSLSLAGGTALYLAGVQYMPSDNATITGSSDGQGYVGQVWGWTLTYSGSTTINQEGLATDGPGNIRIDTACSPSTTCN